MSTANSHHPSLNFGVNGLRRFPPPHSNPPNKPPSSLSVSQHTSPYQAQAYAPQQPLQGGYPSHLFSNPPPPQVNNVASVQNASRSLSSQVPPALPGPRQRAPPPRQMQAQPNPPMTYLHQALNQQSIPQQSRNPQQISQQSMSQPSLVQQSLGQQPSLNQQAIPQPPITQQSMSKHQQNESILSQQSTPHPKSQPTLPPVAQQVQQVQQVQQAQKVQQQPTPPRAEPAEQAQSNHHDDEMDVVGSQDESGDGDGNSLEPKMMNGNPFVPRQPMGAMMSAPPEGGSFPRFEDVHKHVLSYCTSVGYAVVIGRSKKTVPGLKKVLFVCDRAGKPPRRVSPETRKRKTSSRKCDCQFGFFAIEQRTQWTVRYRPDPEHLKHNHGPSDSPMHHPAARKLDSKMVAAVKALKESGVGVTQTLEILQTENPHVPLLPRDIYNARAAINRNPQKVATGLAEDRPAIYNKPHPSADERIRADLRRELSKAREDLDKLKEDHKKEVDELKAKLRATEETIREKDKMLEKFNMFIDICNQRVMLQRDLLADNNGPSAGATSSNP